MSLESTVFTAGDARFDSKTIATLHCFPGWCSKSEGLKLTSLTLVFDLVRHWEAT